MASPFPDTALMYEPRTKPLISTKRFVRRQLRHTAVATALVAFSLIVGMSGYVGFAHMSLVDAFLNAAMLLGGMGPVGDLPNDTAKIFAGVYALYAGVIFIAAAGILVAPLAHRILHSLHAEGEQDPNQPKSR
jgi:hypothetical protein